MYEKISQAIVQKLIKLGTISKDEFEIYKYGFELIVSLLLTTITIVLVSIVINKFVDTLLYLAGFFCVRAICGGYHAKHHLTCFITTLFSYFVFLILNYNCSKFNIIYAIVLMTIISLVLIMAFAPVEHPDNPMTEFRKKRNRLLSVILSAFICMISFVSLISEVASLFIFNYLAGVFLAALAILAAEIELLILKERRK